MLDSPSGRPPLKISRLSRLCGNAQLETLHCRRGQTDCVGGPRPSLSICLAPQNSRTSVGLYRSAVVGDSGLPFTLDFVESWHDNPLLARAFAEKFNAGWTKACPTQVAKCLSSSPRIACPSGQSLTAIRTKRNRHETAELVAKEAGLASDDWNFAFQSQGMSGGAMDRAYCRRNDSDAQGERAQGRFHSSHRLSLRSRRDTLRYRCRIP